MTKKRFSAVGEWEGPEYPELGQIESAVDALKAKGVSAYYGRADDPSDEPIPPEPPPDRHISPGGVHIMLGDNNYYGEYLNILAQAGKPVGCIKSMEDGGLLEAKSASSETVTIWRGTVVEPPGKEGSDFPSRNWYFDSLEECQNSARWWVSQCYPRWEKNPADFFEIINEPNEATDEQLNWLIEWLYTAMVDANAHGFKVGIGSFSSGCPPEPHMMKMLDLLDTCARTGNILCMHDGATTDPLSFRAAYPGAAMRYRMWKQMADDAGKAFPLVALTEVYAYGNISDPEYWNDWRWYLAEMKRDTYCLGACWFTIGQFGTINFAGKPLEKYTEMQLGI